LRPTAGPTTTSTYYQGWGNPSIDTQGSYGQSSFGTQSNWSDTSYTSQSSYAQSSVGSGSNTYDSRNTSTISHQVQSTGTPMDRVVDPVHASQLRWVEMPGRSGQYYMYLGLDASGQ
jgi:hypothetical protein